VVEKELRDSVGTGLTTDRGGRRGSQRRKLKEENLTYGSRSTKEEVKQKDAKKKVQS